jgi:hypothetical protein
MTGPFNRRSAAAALAGVVAGARVRAARTGTPDMMRVAAISIALLMSTTAVAAAQQGDGDRRGGRFERGEDRGQRGGWEGGRRGDNGQRPNGWNERQQGDERQREARRGGDDGQRPNAWNQRNPEFSAAPPAPPQAPPAAQARRGDDYGLRGGSRDDGRGDGQGRQGEWAQRNPDYQRAPAVPQQSAPPAQGFAGRDGDRRWSDRGREDGRRDDGRRDDGRRGDDRREWSRDDGRRDNDRRDWSHNNRNDGGRNDWSRNDWSRNDWRGHERRYAHGGDRWRDRDHGRAWYDHRYYQPYYRASYRYRAPVYVYPHGYFVRHWVYGEYLPRGWYSPAYYLDWRAYGLPFPPIGCEWVRVGSNAILVDVWTGQILSIYYDLFW